MCEGVWGLGFSLVGGFRFILWCEGIGFSLEGIGFTLVGVRVLV